MSPRPACCMVPIPFHVQGTCISLATTNVLVLFRWLLELDGTASGPRGLRPRGRVADACVRPARQALDRGGARDVERRARPASARSPVPSRGSATRCSPNGSVSSRMPVSSPAPCGGTAALRVYALTDAGRALLPALAQISRWASTTSRSSTPNQRDAAEVIPAGRGRHRGRAELDLRRESKRTERDRAAGAWFPIPLGTRAGLTQSMSRGTVQKEGVCDAWVAA